MSVQKQDHTHFQTTVLEYYQKHQRALPWRQPDEDGHFDPYKIMISEYMLQQTQVSRVVPKYEQFLLRFPTVASLAAAPLSEVLITWSGLGYNRRAKFIHEAAQKIMSSHDGAVPKDPDTLATLPGIGANTAAAIITYSFNVPTVFIETNIRTVYIHHFFTNVATVSDAEIIKLVRETLPSSCAREWYWALMDYGTFLKTTAPRIHQKSTHFKKQSPFLQSKRYVRGRVIRQLVSGAMSKEALQHHIVDNRLDEVLADLQKEKLITIHNKVYSLSK